MRHKYLCHPLGVQNMCWLLFVLFSNMRSCKMVVSLMGIS